MTEIEPSQNISSLRRWFQNRAESSLSRAEADAAAEVGGLPGHDGALASERVVVSAPMSFAGSAQRIWHITWKRAGWPLAGMATLALVAIVVAWAVVLIWYVTWGLLLVPYRLIRRGSRKRHQMELRHRELIAAIRHPEP